MSNPRLMTVGFELPNGSGDLIRGDVRYREDGRKHPAIIVCHSFMAFKDWGFFPYLGMKLALSGFLSIVFNFSHNGVSGQNPKITDFERFSKNTFSKELEDLNAVVDAVVQGRIGKNIADTTKIGLLGHSRGGGIVIVHTASDERVGALASWSAIATFDRWTPHQKDAWRRNGYLPMSSDSQASSWRVGEGLLDDLEQHGDTLNILTAASKVQVPWLILHGSADVTVRPREAEFLYTAAQKSTGNIVMLEHVGHLYNGSSREEDDYKTLNNILSITTTWFSRHLSKEFA